VQGLQQGDPVAASRAGGGRGPLSDTVQGQDGRLVKGTGVEGTGRMGFVVLAEDIPTPPSTAQGPVDLAGQVELASEPHGDADQELPEAHRGVGDVGLQEPLEAKQGLLVEDHEVDLLLAEAPGLQAIGDCVGRKSSIMLLAGEPFLLRSSQDPALPDQGRGTVVVERRYPQDVQAASSSG